MRHTKTSTSVGSTRNAIYNIDDEEILMAKRIKENLDRLNEETLQKMRILKQTHQTVAKILAEDEKKSRRMKEKLFQVQERREQEVTSLREKQLDQLERFEARVAKQQIDRQQKSELPSLKEIFASQKSQEVLIKALKRYEVPKPVKIEENEKVKSGEEDQEETEDQAEDPAAVTAAELLDGQKLFSLTAAPVPSNDADRILEKMRKNQQMRGKKLTLLTGNLTTTAVKAKQVSNPFDNKANWDKFMEADRNGDTNIRFQGIGIERTPLHEMQRANHEKMLKQKEKLDNLKQSFIVPSKKYQIDFQAIYDRVKSITSSSIASLSATASETLIGHIMEKSVEDARRVWGKNFLRRSITPSGRPERSMLYGHNNHNISDAAGAAFFDDSLVARNRDSKYIDPLNKHGSLGSVYANRSEFPDGSLAKYSTNPNIDTQTSSTPDPASLILKNIDFAKPHNEPNRLQRF